MKRYALATMSFIALILLSTAAMAQTHQHGTHQAGQKQRQAGMFGNLAPEKHEALVALRNEHRQEVMVPRLELKAKKAELDVLLAAPQADQQRITSVTNEITALYGKILTARNDYRRKVFEESGHLIRGGMKHDARKSFMSGRKGMSPGQMRNCPMVGTPGGVQAE